jgi:hypothetical protein
VLFVDWKCPRIRFNMIYRYSRVTIRMVGHPVVNHLGQVVFWCSEMLCNSFRAATDASRICNFRRVLVATNSVIEVKEFLPRGTVHYVWHPEMRLF